ncbi:ATP-binding protein [Myxococcus sp. 1LA]
MKWESSIILAPHDVALFIGKRGSGKSTRAKAALAKAQEAGQRVLAFDPLDEYSQRGRERSQVLLGPLKQRMTVSELAENLDVLLEDELSLAVVPDTREPEEWARDFTALLVEVEEVGDLVLAADELAVWGEYAQRHINRAACLSRHWGDAGVALVLSSQRATGIPNTTRTQATQINTGIQDAPADLDALADRIGRELVLKVPKLKRGEAIHWQDSA